MSAGSENTGLQRGRWRFVLENLVSSERIEATDQEVACAPDRSALVAVLRGLEALEQPSRVTLVTTSRYVTRGLQYGLSEWRENDYSWEHFGTVQPIRNADIWKRIDRALAYHQVQCRWMAQEGVVETGDESPNAEHIGDLRATLGNKTAKETYVDTGIEHGGDRRATLGTQPKPNRRSRFVEGTRTNVSTTKHQRIFVDTPVSSDPCPIPNIPLRVENPKGQIERSSKRSPSLIDVLYFPIPLVCRGIHGLCGHFWDVILAIDEWLESFLRCLFLLDPSKKPTRR